ncbi:MAG: ABC transporter permease subunit [Ruminococcaceae bacterium]|nr:ABC transporter permease subunit [Oscillospiraceae bacterium]
MRKQRTVFLLLLPFLAVTALVLVSVWNVLVQSFGYIPAFGLTQPTLSYYKAVFTNPDFLSALRVSLKIALWSAALACILGVALSMALIRLKKTRGRAVYLVRFPILIPHAVVAVFMIQLFSQTGLLARAGYALGLVEDYTRFPQLLYTPGYGGTIAAYLWKEIPFVAYFVLAFMGSISDSLGQAAENLGASSARSFWEVTLPLSIPVIARAFLIIFIFAFGGYELPLLLGATMPKALPVQAYLAYMNPDLRQRPLAMAMNGVILLLSILMSAAYWYLVRRASRRMEGSA